MFYWFYEQIEARHATMSLHIPVESVSPPCIDSSAFLLNLVMAHLSLNLAFALLFFEGGPFIIFSFTAGKAQFNLGLTVLYKVYLQWYQGKAFFVELADKFFYFPMMEQ